MIYTCRTNFTQWYLQQQWVRAVDTVIIYSSGRGRLKLLWLLTGQQDGKRKCSEVINHDNNNNNHKNNNNNNHNNNNNNHNNNCHANRRRKYSNNAAQKGRTESKLWRLWLPLNFRVVYKSRQPAKFAGFSVRFRRLLSLFEESRHVEEMMFMRSKLLGLNTNKYLQCLSFLKTQKRLLTQGQFKNVMLKTFVLKKSCCGGGKVGTIWFVVRHIGFQKFGFINGVDNVNWPPYRISVRWPIYIINSVDKTKFLYTTSPPTQHHSFFRNYPFIHIGFQPPIVSYRKEKSLKAVLVRAKLPLITPQS